MRNFLMITVIFHWWHHSVPLSIRQVQWWVPAPRPIWEPWDEGSLLLMNFPLLLMVSNRSLKMNTINSKCEYINSKICSFVQASCFNWSPNHLKWHLTHKAWLNTFRFHPSAIQDLWDPSFIYEPLFAQPNSFYSGIMCRSMRGLKKILLIKFQMHFKAKANKKEKGIPDVSRRHWSDSDPRQ